MVGWDAGQAVATLKEDLEEIRRWLAMDYLEALAAKMTIVRRGNLEAAGFPVEELPKFMAGWIYYELDIIQREKLVRLLTDDERRALKDAELIYYRYQDRYEVKREPDS